MISPQDKGQPCMAYADQFPDYCTRVVDCGPSDIDEGCYPAVRGRRSKVRPGSPAIRCGSGGRSTALVFDTLQKIPAFCVMLAREPSYTGPCGRSHQPPFARRCHSIADLKGGFWTIAASPYFCGTTTKSALTELESLRYLRLGCGKLNLLGVVV
jgi:hypothetical protein